MVPFFIHRSNAFINVNAVQQRYIIVQHAVEGTSFRKSS
jgi:hypothetical protein